MSLNDDVAVEPESPQPKDLYDTPGLGWRILVVGVASLVLPTVAVLFTIIVAAIFGIRFDGLSDTQKVVQLVVGFLGVWAALLGGCFWLSRRYGAKSFSIDYGLKFKLQDIPMGIGLGILIQLCSYAILYLVIFNIFPGSEAHQKKQVQELLPGTGAYRYLIAFAVGICAPIVEEIFFRGLIFRFFERRFSTILGIVGSAVIFGLAHIFGEIYAVPALIIMGLIQAWVVSKTGRLGPAIVSHAWVNMLTVIGSYHAK